MAMYDGASIGKRSESAFQLTLEILKEQGFIVRRALVAFPRSYKLLQGHNDLLQYDKETDLFKRAEARADDGQ